jgi:predicted phage terminase large subunit-like protein
MIEWEDCSPAKRQALRLLSEADYLTFLRIWFQITQGEKWQVNWHHRLLARKAQEIITERPHNVVINVPPGAGKTETLSIHAPAWMVVKVPKFRNLNISFSDSLTKRNSRRTRDLIASEEFQELWPRTFGTNQADEWQLVTRQGKTVAEVVSRSAGGQITGGRGGYIGPNFSGWVLLDDVDKPDDVFSEVRRKRTHQLLVNTVRSRRGDKSRKHPTPILAIQQRLHVDDSSAFMVSGGMGLTFEHVSIPALVTLDYLMALPEDIRPYALADCLGSESVTVGGVEYWSFWPANEDVKDLVQLWESDPYTFTSQYMQQPELLSGGIFRPDDFGLYEPDDVPHWEYRFITVDTAQKTGERHDFSVINHWGMYQGNLHRINGIRGKWEAHELRTRFVQFVRECYDLNGPIHGNLRAVDVEDKSSGTGLIQEASQQLPVKITAVQRSRDKLTRALDAQPHHRGGRVKLRAGDPSNPEFIAEVCSFNADDTHKHDDQTDTMIDAIDRAFITATKPRAGVL